MEGTVQQSTVQETANVVAPAASKASEDYNVSDSELSELGIESLSDDDNVDDSGFEFGNVSANPRLKSAQDDESGGESDEDDLKLSPDKEDEWLKSLKKDLELDDDSESSEENASSQDPLELKEVEIERYGVKHKFPLKEVIKLAQQGFDYTQKTQSHAEERRNSEMLLQKERTDFENHRAQFQQQLKEKEQLDYFVETLRVQDPEFYSELEKRASSFKQQASNPFFERQIQELKSMLMEERKDKQERHTQELRNSYYKEFEDLKSMHNSKYAKLGLRIDEEAIKKQWIDTGEPLKSIYKKLYADKILSLAQSRGSLDKKMKAASNRAPTMGRVRSAHPSKEVSKGQFKKMSYTQLADAVMKGKIK